MRLSRVMRSVSDLASLIYLPVPAEGEFEVTLEMKSYPEPGISVVTEISGPGYYSLQLDGTLRPATAEDAAAAAGLLPDLPDPGDTGDPENPDPVDPGDTDPDDLGCGESICLSDQQVCVAESCVELADQTQGAACDGSENGDCAQGYVCVDAACTKRVNQKNNDVCDDDNDDCADGYICAGQQCRERIYQTNGDVCDDDNNDCADGNICEDQLCRQAS